MSPFRHGPSVPPGSSWAAHLPTLNAISNTKLKVPFFPMLRHIADSYELHAVTTRNVPLFARGFHPVQEFVEDAEPLTTHCYFF
jgi:hypothetical protein